jgi:acyl-CoA dehydrogenase
MIEKAVSFARKHAAACGDLGAGAGFPAELWLAMGEEGLLGLAAPVEYGGAGLGFDAVVEAGRVLTRGLGCLGLTLSWLMHQMVSRFVFSGLADEPLRRRCLPRMSAGKTTAALAISEPGHGAHPRHMMTRAERTPVGYVLDGEKSFITNGPIAGLYVVVAVSGVQGERKLFSSFVLDRASEGLSVRPPFDPGFLRPCPHCAIEMRGCRVGDDGLLGRAHHAYGDLVLPFREVEDVCMAGPVVGALEAILDGVVRTLRQRGGDLQADVAGELGGMASSIGALGVIARKAACSLDDDGTGGDVTALVLAFRDLFAGVHGRLKGLCAQAGIPLGNSARIMVSDLDALAGFASGVSARKRARLGRSLVEGV